LNNKIGSTEVDLFATKHFLKPLLSLLAKSHRADKKRQETRLTPVEHRRLIFHLRMCKYCRNYERQSKLLEEFFKKGATPTEWLSEEQKAKIIAKLSKDR